MDATKKPLRIPPEFARYAEEKEIFQLLEVPFNRLSAKLFETRALPSCLANATRTVGGETGRPSRIYDDVLEETRYQW